MLKIFENKYFFFHYRINYILSFQREISTLLFQMLVQPPKCPPLTFRVHLTRIINIETKVPSGVEVHRETKCNIGMTEGYFFFSQRNYRT